MSSLLSRCILLTSQEYRSFSKLVVTVERRAAYNPKSGDHVRAFPQLESIHRRGVHLGFQVATNYRPLGLASDSLAALFFLNAYHFGLRDVALSFLAPISGVKCLTYTMKSLSMKLNRSCSPSCSSHLPNYLYALAPRLLLTCSFCFRPCLFQSMCISSA